MKSWSRQHYQSTFQKRYSRGNWQIKAGRFRGEQLIEQAFQVSPMNQNYVIVCERFFEFGAGYDVIVTLPPCRSVVRMIDGDGLKFRVVVSEVDNDFGDSRLQVL